jgi:nucleoside-diphosphate-sugar epimerase
VQKIVVTGGSSRVGTVLIRDLIEQGHSVLNVDLRAPQDAAVPTLKADLTDLGQVYEALRGAEVVIHLAQLGQGMQTDEVVFRTNMATTYNVFNVAITQGVERVIWTSSATVFGTPFEREQPMYAPINEEHAAFPESSYALSKVLSEELAWEFSRWSKIPFLGLRIPTVTEPADYQRFMYYWGDPWQRKSSLWGYVDYRDVAQALRKAVSARLQDADVCIVAAADTVMKQPSRDLLAQIFPDIPVQGHLSEFGTLLSIEKARDLLGYEPRHSWRNYL